MLTGWFRQRAKKMNKSPESTEIVEEVLPEVDEIIPEFLKEKAPVGEQQEEQPIIFSCSIWTLTGRRAWRKSESS